MFGIFTIVMAFYFAALKFKLFYDPDIIAVLLLALLTMGYSLYQLNGGF